MIGALTGFAVIAVAIIAGYVAGRTGVLGPHARYVLSRLVFFVLSPFLLFTVLATADVRILFSALLPVSALAAVSMFVIFAVIALVVWRRRAGSVVVGSLASGYVNANNIGLPIALYMLGDAALAAPVVLLQLLVFTPVALAILDAEAQGRASVGRIVGQTFTNPIILGSLAGLATALITSATGTTLPEIVLEPLSVVGHAAIPLMLISFGMSLHGQKMLEAGSGRRDVLLASGLKLLVMPVAAWLIGRFVFGVEGHALYAVTVLAALPTAQNVFNYAQRYERSEILARDTVFLTTLGSIPVLLVVSLLLA
ncbi:AEC family transporter [Agromyces atrinae]|uniref:AEC family transporter n=1 Tax=Agromyces atrinae TaxID=592376 RepID=UPI001F5AB2DE|nr:AEC family transporter [Agromyces atrinae]MCI2956204.1 AEC family transporter [Agromyces atrinae]